MTTRIQTTSRGTTKVKRVTVGKPVKRINPARVSIDNIIGVDTSGKTDGSVLVYNSSSSKFEATTTLDKQLINGGQY